VTEVKTEVTLEAMVERVRFHAAAHPNYVYVTLDHTDKDTCLYFDRFEDGTTACACLLGFALKDLGFTAEDLERHEGKDIPDVIADLGIEPDGDNYFNRVLWLEKVQVEQDNSRSWGQAVAVADMEYADV